MRNKVIALVAMIFLQVGNVHAVNLGKVGATYPIIERDMLQVIKETLNEIDTKKFTEEVREKGKKYIMNYRPPGLVSLPTTERDDSFSVDMTWTLPFDIPDGKGGIIYPKGFTFNPLEYTYLPSTLVFIDVSDQRQVNWFMQSPYVKKIDAKILLTGGDYYHFMRKIKRPVFYADDRIIKRLQIRSVPSVAVQQGKLMAIYEFAPESRKSKRGSK